MNSVNAECGICFECYDEENRRPLVLPCSHSFCQSCLEKLESQGDKKCSSCRRDWTQTTVRDLLSCFQLIPSADATPKKKPQLCTELDAEISIWCKCCAKDICMKCLWLDHKNCEWLPKDEKLKADACEEYSDCLEGINRMVSKNNRTIISLDNLIEELSHCRNEVAEWQEEAELQLDLSPETESLSDPTVSLSVLQSLVGGVKEVMTKLPTGSLATLESFIHQKLGSGLSPATSPIVAIGVDLGLTYSCVGIVRGNKVNIIANDVGERQTPNYVVFTDSEICVGSSAKELQLIDPENSVFHIRKLIGSKFSEAFVKEDMKEFPFKVIEDKRIIKIRVKYMGRLMKFTPVEISSMLLKKLKRDAESYIGSTVTHAVISVPVSFNDSQRQATQEASRLAGLEVLELIDEPSAAAIAYGVDKSGTDQRNIVVFNLDQNSLDVSVVQFSEGEFEIKATGDSSHIGREKFCNRLVEYSMEEISRNHEIDLSNNQRAMERLKIASEQATEELSTRMSTQIHVQCLINGEDFRIRITRSRFGAICSVLFQHILDTVRDIITESTLTQENIHEVIMTGDSSPIPQLRDRLQGFFSGAKFNNAMCSHEVVAYGAALRAGRLVSDTSIV